MNKIAFRIIHMSFLCRKSENVERKYGQFGCLELCKANFLGFFERVVQNRFIFFERGLSETGRDRYI